MKQTLKLIRVGMTMEEASLVAWRVKPGESFAKDDILYEIETEKVVEEVAASAAGKMLEHLVEEGAEMMVDDDVCVVEYESAA